MYTHVRAIQKSNKTTTPLYQRCQESNLILSTLHSLPSDYLLPQDLANAQLLLALSQSQSPELQPTQSINRQSPTKSQLETSRTWYLKREHNAVTTCFPNHVVHIDNIPVPQSDTTRMRLTFVHPKVDAF